MPNPTTTLIPLGNIIDGCQLIEKIGEGGMGEVYLAKHLSLKTYRAIKILPPAQVDEARVQRFLHEARACAQVDHPNVVSIHNVGMEKGFYFISMQHVLGKNLAEIVEDRGRPLPWKLALQIISSAASGLVAVHHRGLVHRDIKPANIMVREDSRVFLMDFGLVRTDSNSELTQPGMIMGTPAYMSPEQCSAQELDHRTDVYSLGATLYYLLTARLPFDGNGFYSVARQIAAGEPPRINRLNSQVPPEVVRIVSKAMATQRERRYASAQQLLDDISSALKRVSAREKLTADTFDFSTVKTQFQSIVQSGPSYPTNRLRVPSATTANQTPPWRIVGGIIAFLAMIGFFLYVLIDNKAGPQTPSGDVVAEVHKPASTASNPMSPRTRTETTADGKMVLVVPEIQGDRRIDVTGMVHIPPGSAWLGDREARLRAHLSKLQDIQRNPTALEQVLKSRFDPEQQVAVGEFWIDQYEVTNAQYAEFVQATAHPPPKHWGGRTSPTSGLDHPVTHVGYNDAVVYAEWRNKKLPTVAQWMRACRGDTQQFYSWGDDLQDQWANVFENKSFRNTSPVTATPRDRSPFGVFNLTGNVREITRDRRSIQGRSAVVLKGANWKSEGLVFGIASQRVFGVIDSFADSDVGFRCVVEVAN